MKDVLKFFNVTANRPQKKMDKEDARNLLANMHGNNPDLIGRNGKMRGWAIGTLVQMSKRFPKDSKNRLFQLQFNPISSVVGKRGYKVNNTTFKIKLKKKGKTR